MEGRNLVIFLLGSLLMPLAVLAGPFLLLNGPSDLTAAPDSPVCLSEGCVVAAGDLLTQMDRNVDPCQDFYNFACGGYIANTVLPQDKTEIGFSFYVTFIFPIADDNNDNTFLLFTVYFSRCNRHSSGPSKPTNEESFGSRI